VEKGGEGGGGGRPLFGRKPFSVFLRAFSARNAGTEGGKKKREGEKSFSGSSPNYIRLCGDLLSLTRSRKRRGKGRKEEKLFLAARSFSRRPPRPASCFFFRGERGKKKEKKSLFKAMADNLRSRDVLVIFEKLLDASATPSSPAREGKGGGGRGAFRSA